MSLHKKQEKYEQHNIMLSYVAPVVNLDGLD
jgi:hypothetical protein